ncbi:hypothetical protein FRC10_002858 [Ceratobasidium sp. 414]|nr:hypothetical protein FRC10_002858 [Ceratobasidium sp. 414]
MMIEFPPPALPARGSVASSAPPASAPSPLATLTGPHPVTPVAPRPISPAVARAVKPPPFAHLVPCPTTFVSGAVTRSVASGSTSAMPAARLATVLPAGTVAPPAASSASNKEQLHVDLARGYLVSFIHSWAEYPSVTTRARGCPLAAKKMQLIKSERMQVDVTSRQQFGDAGLTAHNLEDSFKSSPTKGFPYKMWHTLTK